MFIRNVLSFIGLFVLSTISFSATFYVDPENGSPDGDGSYEKPWRTMQEVYEAKLIQGYRWWPLPYSEESTLQRINEGAPVKQGDTILLRSGDHGRLSVLRHINKNNITIKNDFEAEPFLTTVRFRAASGWVIEGINIKSDEETKMPYFSVYDHSWSGPSTNITLKNSKIVGVQEECDQDRCFGKRDGVVLNANGIDIIGNDIEYVRIGISSRKNKVKIIDNNINLFTKDGIRIIGNDSIVDHNIVTNSIAVDNNHDDMLQSWSVGDDRKVGTGVTKNNHITNNIFITNTDEEPDDLDQAQGIGSFDGFYEGWVIEGNVIIASHWHGITFYGVRDTLIKDNIVLDLWNDGRGPAQIRIWPHKNGEKSSNNKVYGNFTHRATKFDGYESKKLDGNFIYKKPLNYEDLYDFMEGYIEDGRLIDTHRKFYGSLKEKLIKGMD